MSARPDGLNASGGSSASEPPDRMYSSMSVFRMIVVSIRGEGDGGPRGEVPAAGGRSRAAVDVQAADVAAEGEGQVGRVVVGEGLESPSPCLSTISTIRLLEPRVV